MLNQIKQRLQSRRHAGRLLAEKMAVLKADRIQSVVLAIPQGGVPVAHEISLALDIPLEIIFSKRIKHPAHSDQSIGAVSMDEVVLHETIQYIPQSYVLNQITLLQRNLQEQFNRYYGDRSQKSVKGKTVLLVDDVMRDEDDLIACLHTIERQKPDRLIVAAAVASIKIVNYLEDHQYEFHYLFTELNPQSKAYTYFPEIDEEELDEVLKIRNRSISEKK
jgi:putative phosphoribosyl transferase